MAETNSDQFSTDNSIQIPGFAGGGVANIVFGSRAVSADPTANDTLNMFVFPNGFTPIYGFLYGQDLDTGSETIDIDVGLGTLSGSTVTVNDDDYFGNLGVQTGDAVTNVKPEVSIWMPLGNLIRIVKPVELGANRVCVITFVASAATISTGVLGVSITGVQRDPRVGL